MYVRGSEAGNWQFLGAFVGLLKTFQHTLHSVLLRTWETQDQVVNLHNEDVHIVDHGIHGFIR